MSGGGGGFGSGKRKGGLGGLFGNDSSAVVDVYLNLTPLMDVMSNILFFLMSSFGASIVAIMPVTVPLASTTGDTSIEKEADKVTLTVKMENNTLTTSCESDTIAREDLRFCAVTVPGKDGGYDTAAFNAHVTRIKDKYPGSSTMILVPEETIRYELIVRVMDAARNARTTDDMPRTLFPDVVLSGLTTAPAGKRGK